MAARVYEEMNYRQIQKWNQVHLDKDLDKQRKRLKLKNVGWSSVIELYQWITTAISPIATSGSSTLLNQLSRKAEQLKQIEVDIKTVIHSVTDEDYQAQHIPRNNIAEFVYR